MYQLQVYGLFLEFVGAALITYETIKGQQYHATRTEVKDYPKYYDYSWDKNKGLRMTPTKFPKQWKRLILWLSVMFVGLFNQLFGMVL
jgi:hypothetical protein